MFLGRSEPDCRHSATINRPERNREVIATNCLQLKKRIKSKQERERDSEYNQDVPKKSKYRFTDDPFMSLPNVSLSFGSAQREPATLTLVCNRSCVNTTVTKGAPKKLLDAFQVLVKQTLHSDVCVCVRYVNPSNSSQWHPATLAQSG